MFSGPSLTTGYRKDCDEMDLGRLLSLYYILVYIVFCNTSLPRAVSVTKFLLNS